MAGDSSSDDFGVREQPAPADVPVGALNPEGAQLPPTVPVLPAQSRGKPGKATWKTLFAALPGYLVTALAHLGSWLTQFGSWLAGVGRRLARIGEIKPTPLQKLALLSGLAAAGIVGALAFPGNAVGQACIVAFVPGLCIAIGILGTRWHSGQGLNQHLVKATHNAVSATLQLTKSVRYVDDRLSAAQAHLENGSGEDALLEVVRAKTATELTLGVVEQAPRQRELGPDVHARIRGDQPQPELIGGSVARVEDEFTLIINRGSEHGMRPDMVFAVLSDDGDPIRDPETGEVIAESSAEKLRVKVTEVQPKYSRAVTFRTIAPAMAEYPALAGFAEFSRTAATPADTGVFDFVDESISRMIEHELAASNPMREKISNAKPAVNAPTPPGVRIDVGDRVRQLR